MLTSRTWQVSVVERFVVRLTPHWHPPTISHHPDPCVLEHDNTLYIYNTGDQTNFYAYSAPIVPGVPPSEFDFKRSEEPVFSATDQDKRCPITTIVPALGKGTLTWAPDVRHDESSGKFYMYFSICLQLYVASADSPLGPFTSPVLLQTLAIDPMLFQDDDGSIYLYYAKIDLLNMYTGEESIYVRRMLDYSTIDESVEAKMLITPDTKWEFPRSSLIAPRGINEGPWMYKLDGTYYLMYSGAGADTMYYNLGYATSSSPDGTFTKSETNPISQPQSPPDVGIYGPGHHAIWEDGEGKAWVIYHQQRDNGTGWGRFLCMDELEVNGDGELEVTFTRDE